MKTELLNLLGEVVALGALIIAIFSHYVFNKRFSGINTKFLETINVIEKLAMSVTTHKIDEFPKNLSEIIKLIDSAEKSIEIYSDLTCCGIYSAPEASEKYRNLLLKKKADALSENISVRIYTYNKECTKNIMNKFFNPNNITFDEIKKSHYATVFLKERINHQKYEKLKNIEEIEAFAEYLTEEEMAFKKKLDDDTSRETYENIQIGSQIPFFMWIKDDMDAIIDFPYVEIGKEYSIQTSDRNLIGIFKNFLVERTIEK